MPREIDPVERFRCLLRAETAGAPFSLPDDCLDRLTEHYRLLRHWNRKVRLVGDTHWETVARRHVLESLFLIPYVHEPRGSLLDIGSGNGFPAMPLKCALPDLRLVMMEPTLRKGVFLETAVDKLGLQNASVLRDRVDRAEDLIRHGRWDTITMRAVSAIARLVEAAPRVLRPAGRLLLMVGEAGRTECRRLVRPPLETVHEVPLPGRHSSYLVAIENRAGRR